MIHYFIYDENGRIFRAGTNMPECIDLISAEVDGTVRIHPEPFEIGSHYWDGGLIPYPPKPDRWSEFDYVAKRWVPDVDAAADSARAERDRLLTACDWTQVPDAPVDKAAWQAYRQALRDITDQGGFPFNIIWPQEPK